jgi:hypothetical protein
MACKLFNFNDLAPQVGLEPTTLRLTAESQREALRRCVPKGLNSGRKKGSAGHRFARLR